MVGAAEQSVAAFGVRLELAVRTRLVPALIARARGDRDVLGASEPVPTKTGVASAGEAARRVGTCGICGTSRPRRVHTFVHVCASQITVA